MDRRSFFGAAAASVASVPSVASLLADERAYPIIMKHISSGGLLPAQALEIEELIEKLKLVRVEQEETTEGIRKIRKTLNELGKSRRSGGVTGGGQDSDPITAKAEAIAAELKDLPQFAGFETILIAILSSLLPMLLKCLFPDPEPPTPAQMKARVNKEWNPRRQAYDRDFIRRGKIQARKQAKAENRLLTDKQAELMVITSADHFRLGDDDDLQLFGQATWASSVKAAVED